MVNKFKAGDVVLVIAGYERGLQGVVVKQIDTLETLGYNCYYEVLFDHPKEVRTKHEDYIELVRAKDKLLHWLSS